MTPADCQKLMDHIEIIRHVAEGGMVEHALHDYKGRFIEWSNPTTKVLIPCLGQYRIAKRRIRMVVCPCCQSMHAACSQCGAPLAHSERDA